MPRPHPLITTLALAVTVLAGAAACTSGGDAPPATTVPPRPGGLSRLGTTVPATAPTGSPSPGTATITRFDVPATVTCTPGGDAPLAAEIATDGVRTQITVDNRALADATPTAGSFTVPLPCDGSVHTVVLAAFDAEGKATLQSRAVLADDQRAG